MLVQVFDAACGYPDHLVLEHVNFTLREGEIVALLGQNGSGKSTLLKSLAKSLHLRSGRAHIGGDDLASLGYRDLSRRLAFVPQEESHVFAFSVREVVLMGRLPYSDALYESDEDRHLAEVAMSDADCEHLADRPITELSGGERQRVLIARALAQQTRLLLLDEPTAHLDVAHQLAVGELLRRLAGKGYGILVAVHDLNWAATFATRGLLLHEGRVVMDAPMTELQQSEVLERAYGVQFARIEGPQGVVHVVPTPLGKVHSE